MRIALSCRTYPTQRPGGMPFVCQDRAEALAAMGHDVHVLTTGWDGPIPEQPEGLTLHHLDVKSQVYSKEFADACVAACNFLSPDIIHLDSFDRERQWWTSRPGSPEVTAVTMHGFGPGAFLTKWNLWLAKRDRRNLVFDAAGMAAEAKALLTFNQIIGISRHEQWMLQDLYGLLNAKLVYNPIAPCFFLPAGKKNRPPQRLSFICAGNPGTSGNRDFNTARRAATKARAKAKIVSGQTRAQMPDLYRSASALVLPTFWAQGYDLTVAEALACCRPVIVTGTGSYLREAEVNPYLILVPRNNERALTEAMLGMLPLVPEGAAEQHRPATHARAWLEAVLG